MVVYQEIKASSSEMDPGRGFPDFFVDEVIFYVNFTRKFKLKKRQTEQKSRISWNEIATGINNLFYNGEFMRTGRQCRDRWVHHLNPKFCRVPWSVDEDLKILRFVMENGKKWAQLSKIMENRNEDSIRNRFIKLIKSYRKKEKTVHIKKSNYKMFSKMVIELDKQQAGLKNKQNEELNVNIGKKRPREHTFEIDKVVYDQNSRVKQLETETRKLNSSKNGEKIAKYEEIAKKSSENLLKEENQNHELKIDKNITIVNNFSDNQTNQKGQMGKIFWQIEALKNQIFQQQLIMQNMQLIMSNLIWSSSMNKNI